MRARLITILLLGAAAPVQAQNLQAAQDLASVLAAESLCGLTFDQPAIAAWIEKNVPADDMSFNSNLQMFVAGNEFQQKSVSTSQKAALCAQATRVAKSFGFVK